MNLTKLFATQKVLDEKIVSQKQLEGRDLLPEKILALQVELGELANEWRGFKFWSGDREPRVGKPTICEFCKGTTKRFAAKDPKSRKRRVELIRVDCNRCKDGYWGTHNPLLEEYVDCLHFILSIGLEREFVSITLLDRQRTSGVTPQFNKLFRKITDFSIYPNLMNYKWIWSYFLGLGEMLGFDLEQIETAYFKKNEINHTRQDNGY